jgi:hypothetical protein
MAGGQHQGSAKRAEINARNDAFEDGVCHAIDELREIAKEARDAGQPSRADSYADELERRLFTPRETR